MEFSVVRGNIADVSADALVLPANEKLKEGSGTSAAIFKAAGRSKLAKACAEYKHCDTGSAVATPAFDLDAKYIIHAVVPKWIDGNHDEYGLLSSAYLAALHIADVMKCKSIAFPLLSSGNNGFDRTLAFQIAQRSIHEFIGENLENVILVVYGENTECFVRSQGIDVEVLPEKKSAQKHIDKSENVVLTGLQSAGNWLKNTDNIKKIVDIGLSIASAVIPTNGIANKVINTIRQKIK